MSPVPQGEDNRDKPPDHPDDELTHQDPPDAVIDAGDSSDSEGDNDFGGYMGYQMLPQEAMDNGHESESDDGDDLDENASGNAQAGDGQLDEAMIQHVPHQDVRNTQNLPGYMKVPDMPRPEKSDLLWNQPRHCGMGMDPGHADKIRSVMSGFQLPTSHIPDWAKSLNENQWQEQVVNRLVGHDSCDNKSEGSDNSGSSLQQNVCDSQTEAGNSVGETGISEDTASEELPNSSGSGVGTSES